MREMFFARNKVKMTKIEAVGYVFRANHTTSAYAEVFFEVNGKFNDA
jgi:hypothetical protein